MNVKHLFWKIWLGEKAWSKYKSFGFEYCKGQLGGIDYFAIIAFNRSIIYSDNW